MVDLLFPTFHNSPLANTFWSSGVCSRPHSNHGKKIGGSCGCEVVFPGDGWIIELLVRSHVKLGHSRADWKQLYLKHSLKLNCAHGIPCWKRLKQTHAKSSLRGLRGSPSCAWKLAHRDHLMYQWEWVRKDPVGQQDRNKEMFQNTSLRRIWTEQENTSRKRRVPELDAKICWVFL